MMLLQGSTATALSSHYWWAGTAPSPQNPQHESCAEVPDWHTAHWHHYTSPVCHFSLSCATQSPQPAWTTLASHKSQVQNPLWDIRCTYPTCILQPVQEEKCLYLCVYLYLYYKLLLRARGVLWAALGHLSKQRFHCHDRGVLDAAAHTGKAKPGPEMPDHRRRQQSSSLSNPPPN